MKLIVLTCAVTALLLALGPVHAEEKQEAMVEHTTESPIADMALVDTKVDDMKADDHTVMTDSVMKADKEAVQKLPADAQPHTIADFIIHPLIALKPRVPENESGKQADTGSTTPSPWQLFGFNAGQGLGSSVSSLAGSVTGWLGNRIQLPGLVDTPVRETSTTTSTTTTTTPRPDVVVRVKQRASTRKPLISINNSNNHNNNGPKRRNKRPNRFNNNIDDSEEEDDSEEFEEDEDFNRKRKRYQNHDDDDEDDDDEEGSNENDGEEEEDDNDDEDDGHNHDDEEEEEEQKPVKPQNTRRRRPKPLNHNNYRRRNTNNNNQRRRFNNNQRRRQQQRKQEESSEEEQYEDDNDDQDFYYSKNQGSKRSQNEQNFIQRGQQSLLNQIRHLTRGQTPAEVTQSLRKSLKSVKKTRGQPATLIINRNGQTIYVAPELLQVADDSNNQITAAQTRRPTSHYPQPPLTVPYRRKGQPTQYITIPWSQLGISPPDQIVSVTEGIQSKPLILNIPQSAIDSMQSFKPTKKKPVITADAVPLLAEASIMDIFKPPRIPPARTPTTTKPTKKVTPSGTPVVIATKTKAGPTRIRPATVVEKAPADDQMDEEKTSAETTDSDTEPAALIVIGDESGETELSRQAYQQILEYFNQKRVGRELNADDLAPKETSQTEEQTIPVKVVTATEQKEEEEQEVPAKVESPVADKLEMESEATVMDSPKEETMEEVKEDKTETIMESATSA